MPSYIDSVNETLRQGGEAIRRLIEDMGEAVITRVIEAISGCKGRINLFVILISIQYKHYKPHSL